MNGRSLRPSLHCLAISCAVLAACASSPPMRFYTLSEVAPERQVPAPAQVAPVRVGRVTIPGELDRAQLVRRIDSTRLQIEELDRWAAPLEEMIRRVLAADLAARLPEKPGDPAGTAADRVRLLSVDVRDFYADTACAVTLRAEWFLKDGDALSARGSEELRTPANGACVTGSIPQAMSRAIAELGDRIAAAIAR